MTLLIETGQRYTETVETRIIDELLRSRRLLGPRCWGMVHLYYRAGLSHQEIADVFGLTRQAVTGQLNRAFKLLLWAALTRQPELAGVARELTEEETRQARQLLGEDFDPYSDQVDATEAADAQVDDAATTPFSRARL